MPLEATASSGLAFRRRHLFRITIAKASKRARQSEARAMRFLIGLITVLFFATASFAQNYILKPGDVLNIEVIEDSSLNRSVLVLPDGSITFPFAGSIRAAGRTVTQVQNAIRNALA